MFQHIFNRVCLFALAGAIGMALAGAFEGAITGAIFHTSLQHPHLGEIHWLLGRDFNGAREAAQLGWLVGALLGFVSFAAIAPFHPGRQAGSLLWHLLKFGILGTIVGVPLGAISGAIFGVAIMWFLSARGIAIETNLWPVTPPFAPLVVRLSESALFGYTWGVLLGFILGLCLGLSIGVRRIPLPMRKAM